MANPSIIFAYWNVRGFGQPTRTLLEYAGVEYEDKKYELDTSDLKDMAKAMGQWGKDKAECPLIVGGNGEQAMEFPDLPYYVETMPDGSKLKISQSLTILRHVGRKTGFVVDGEYNVAKMEQYEQQIMDMRTDIVNFCYDKPTMKYQNYAEDVRSKVIAKWDKVLDGKKWIMGDKLTYVDFLFWEYIDWHVLLKADMLDGLENLKGYHQRFADLPKIKEYFNSSRYQSWPLVSPWAKKFGYYR